MSIYVFCPNPAGGRARAKYEVPPDWTDRSPDFLANQALIAAAEEDALGTPNPSLLSAVVVYTNLQPLN